MKNILLALVPAICILVQSCVSTASLSNYPLSPQSIDFEKIARSEKKEIDPKWNKKTGFEYYLTAQPVSNEELTGIITRVLKDEQYKIKYTDNGVLLAERGLRANEWKSVTGIYFRNADSLLQVYVRSHITQDVTGGWREDRAEIIGKRICTLLGGCRQSYPVKSVE